MSEQLTKTGVIFKSQLGTNYSIYLFPSIDDDIRPGMPSPPRASNSREPIQSITKKGAEIITMPFLAGNEDGAAMLQNYLAELAFRLGTYDVRPELFFMHPDAFDQYIDT